MDIFQKDGIEQLRLRKWESQYPGLCAGITTRNGGKSTGVYDTFNMGLHVPDVYEHVIHNRNHLADLIDFPVVNWVSGSQIHKTNIHTVQATDKGKGSTSFETSIPQVDGLITNKKGILNTAFFADCVPLFFFDPTSGYIGIAHAGWKGTVGRIAKNMVQKLTEAGANIKSLLVGIGPSISTEFYEVDEHVISHVDKELIPIVAYKNENNRYFLNLKQLNKQILMQSGVTEEHIDVTEYCTYRDKKTFFSHRRDNGKTGRMLGFIGIRS